ncbi:MAG: hypothetical protein J7J76_00480 [Candidatus Latescibacteria bacterium]|nr:hypothetical protein [Candidatus Latescibacterota bacterium]
MESVREVPRNVNHLTEGREMGPHTGAGIRDEWELIRDVAVAEDTSSVTLSGLDGNSDIVYLLLVHYRNPTDSGVCCDIRFNHDCGNNYAGIVIYSDGSELSTLSRTMSAIGFVGAAGKNIGWGSALIYARAGTERMVLIEVYEPTLRLDHKGWHWANTQDNITSIELVSLSVNTPVENAIGKGTRIMLSRIKRSIL